MKLLSLIAVLVFGSLASAQVPVQIVQAPLVENRMVFDGISMTIVETSEGYAWQVDFKLVYEAGESALNIEAYVKDDPINGSLGGVQGFPINKAKGTSGNIFGQVSFLMDSPMGRFIDNGGKVEIYAQGFGVPTFFNQNPDNTDRQMSRVDKNNNAN